MTGFLKVRSEHPESIQRQLAGFLPKPSQLFQLEEYVK